MSDKMRRQLTDSGNERGTPTCERGVKWVGGTEAQPSRAAMPTVQAVPVQLGGTVRTVAPRPLRAAGRGAGYGTLAPLRGRSEAVRIQ